MTDASANTSGPLHIQPERGLGWITLGSSLHNIITRLKASPQLYSHLNLSYTPSNPVTQPVILSLPNNGLRLRFDGPDQRLRLIEVLDFSLTSIAYKNIDLVRRNKSSDEGHQDDTAQSRPSFKHLYNRLFGPTYAGEYVPPVNGLQNGTYVLSYPGLAFSFPVRHNSWSDKVDFVALLSSNATGPASSMAIFSGASWSEARSTLYTKPPILPRLPNLIGKSSDVVADEIEQVRVLGGGKLELTRRSSSPFILILSETTPQDLVAELGPPDAIYRKHDSRISIHAKSNTGARRPSISPGLDAQALETDHSSLQSYTEDSDIEAGSPIGREVSDECFYNYFHHGFDILIASSTSRSEPLPGNSSISPLLSSSTQLVATKIFLHGNIPGSFSFNRHRRSRWVIQSGNTPENQGLTSEMPFSEISSALKEVWKESYKDKDEQDHMQRGMVLNRGWSESPDSSIELLGDLEEDTPDDGRGDGKDTLENMSNTELFGFPGMLFEVLKNDAVSCLTVF